MPTKLLAYLRRHHVALLALFVALGGTSYAAATGSIDSREIKNNAVRSKDIRNNQVQSRDVRNFSLLEKDFKPGQLPAGPTGPLGPRGATGPTGAPGPTSAAIAGTTPPTENGGAVGTSVTTTRTGRLFVFASVVMEVQCTTGAPTLGLYVDSVPVPASQHHLPGPGQQSVTLFGVTAARVAAGNHGVQAGSSCSGGGPPSSTVGGLFPTFGAVVLGS